MPEPLYFRLNSPLATPGKGLWRCSRLLEARYAVG